MRVLVCGDRHWGLKEIDGIPVYDPDQVKLLTEKLDVLNLENNFTCVIEGEAKGADTLGRLWAEARGVPVEAYPAEWNRWRHAAGPIRNKQMLVEGKPDLVVAFHNDIENSKGTKNMVTLAKKNLVTCIIFAQNKEPEKG